MGTKKPATGRYYMFDRFGGAPPSFVIADEDKGYVEIVDLDLSGAKVPWPFLTNKGRAQYERDNGGPHPQGWATATNIAL